MVKTLSPHKPLTRIGIEQQLYVSHGIIMTFGEFFGEMVYIPYFWDLAENRKHSFVHEDEHKVVWRFTAVTDAMLSEFPELHGTREVGVARQRGQVVSWVRSVHSERLPV